MTVKAITDRGAPGGAAIAWAFGIGGLLSGAADLDEQLSAAAIAGCGLVPAGLVVLATGAQAPRATASGPLRSRVRS